MTEPKEGFVARYQRWARETVPEAPGEPWWCPVCGMELAAGVAFCAHVRQMFRSTDGD